MQAEFLESLLELYERDLNRLENEINAYTDSSSLWLKGGEIKNAAANLALHLCGNLQHYIGLVLGKISYSRNREYEFAATDLEKEFLLSEIRKTKQSVLEAIKGLDTELLLRAYPEKVFDRPMTSLHFLIHLHAHLSYHLGQINYHRRMIAVVTGN